MIKIVVLQFMSIWLITQEGAKKELGVMEGRKDHNKKGRHSGVILNFKQP